MVFDLYVQHTVPDKNGKVIDGENNMSPVGGNLPLDQIHGLLCRIEQETSCANHVERIDSQPIKAEELAPKHCQGNER